MKKKTPGDIITLHLHTTNDDHMMYGSWDMGHDRHNFLSFWTIFLPFYNPPNKSENQKFEKMKKILVDIIILHMCTINENHMMNGSWDMERDRQNFFLILDHYLPFYPPNNPENQNFEQMKKTPGDIIISHKCTINDNYMMYDFCNMKCDRQNILSFWAIFCPFTPQTTQKIKIWKKGKNTWRYYHSTQVY